MKGKIELATAMGAIFAIALIGIALAWFLPTDESRHIIASGVEAGIWFLCAVGIAWLVSRLRFQRCQRLCFVACVVWVVLVMVQCASHGRYSLCGAVYPSAFVVVSLILSWARSRFKISTHTLLGAVSIAICATLGLKVAETWNETERNGSFAFDEVKRNEMVTAPTSRRNALSQNSLVLRDCLLSKACWIGASRLTDIKRVPYFRQAGVTAGAAVAWGRVVPLTWLVLNLVIAFALVRLLLRSEDPSARLYIAGFGAAVVLPALIQAGECLCIVPSLGTLNPLINIGASTLVVGGGAGVVISALRENSCVKQYKAIEDFALHKDGKQP